MLQRRQWHPTPVLVPGKSHGRRSLVACSPWGREESDTHWRRNGNPLQYSCLENPRDGGAWWAAIYGIIHSQTRLKWCSSSSSVSVNKESTCNAVEDPLKKEIATYSSILSGKSHGWTAWWTTVHRVTKESDMPMTKQQQRVNFRIISSTTAFNSQSQYPDDYGALPERSCTTMT